jgi:PAS domain S-box-containing protein
MYPLPLEDARLLLDISDDLLLLLKWDMRIAFVNSRIKALGYSPKEVLGRSFFDLLSIPDRARIERDLERLEKGERLRRNVNLLMSSGETQPARLFLAQAIRPEETPKFIVRIQFLTSEGVLAHRILETIDSGVIFIDILGRILYINRHAREILGLNGDHSMERLPKEVRDRLFEMVQSEKKHGELNLPNGKILGLSSYAFRENGNNLGWVVLCKDITEIKLLERAMAQLNKFSSLGTLASGLAHEIKNPLAGMRLIAQSLAQELEGKKRESVLRMVRQIDRIDNLVKTFFSYAKPHSPNRRPCKLTAVVEEVEELLKENLKKRGIVLSKDFPEDTVVLVDYNHLQQILLNLMLNAIDVMPKGGTIRISIEREGFKDPETQKPLIGIVVEDTGPGIDEADLERVFYPFYTTKPEGTGLGLFIVHQLVKENKGYIEVKSKKGEGSKFIVYLPPVEVGEPVKS